MISDLEAAIGYRFRDIQLLRSAVTGQKYRTVCFNDSKTDIDFDALQPKLAGAFERMFPEKSTFEI